MVATIKVAENKPSRIVSIDALRGFIMVIMALDHAHSFLSFGSSSEFWGGPLREFQSGAAFLTRFITHICAPGFFLLMGISMVYFVQARKNLNWTEGQIRHYFLVRGGIIVAVHFALSGILALPSARQGNFGIVFNVLFILGLAMIINGFLTNLAFKQLAFISLVCLIVPEFILGNLVEFGQSVHPVFQLLFVPGPMGNHNVYYTLFPWIGYCTLGIGFGKLLIHKRKKAISQLPYLALVGFAFFFLLRAMGGFGNIRPLEGSGWMAFLSLTKYPPSMTFSLFMISTNALLLYFFEWLSDYVERYGKFILVFGRSALFFYVIHHFIYIAMMLAGFRRLPLLSMYMFWILGLVIAYPLCKGYAGFKRRQPAESFWRLF